MYINNMTITRRMVELLKERWEFMLGVGGCTRSKNTITLYLYLPRRGVWRTSEISVGNANMIGQFERSQYCSFV